jgi:hypothetical protein
MVDVPEPGAGSGLGLKDVPAPLDKVTAESKPPLIVDLMVEVPELPLATVIDRGDALRVKLPVDDTGARALIRPEPLGLPHPLAKS